MKKLAYIYLINIGQNYIILRLDSHLFDTNDKKFMIH